jgi:hypothetical protein
MQDGNGLAQLSPPTVAPTSHRQRRVWITYNKSKKYPRKSHPRYEGNHTRSSTSQCQANHDDIGKKSNGEDAAGAALGRTGGLENKKAGADKLSKKDGA